MYEEQSGATLGVLKVAEPPKSHAPGFMLCEW